MDGNGSVLPELRAIGKGEPGNGHECASQLAVKLVF